MMEVESLRDNRQLLCSRQEKDNEGWRQPWRPLTCAKRPFEITEVSPSPILASQIRSGRGERYRTRCPNRSYNQTAPMMGLQRVVLAIIILSSLASSTLATFVPYVNCLDQNYINSNPKELQFQPWLVNAIFDATNSSHNLHITIYGNVSGKATNQTLPPPSNISYWQNDNETVGKITDLSPTNNRYSTLLTTFNVLSYTPYSAPSSRFCESLVQGHCPLAPVFWENSNE